MKSAVVGNKVRTALAGLVAATVIAVGAAPAFAAEAAAKAPQSQVVKSNTTSKTAKHHHHKKSAAHAKTGNKGQLAHSTKAAAK